MIAANETQTGAANGLPISAKSLDRFTPEDCAGRDDAPVYLLRPISPHIELEIDADLRRLRARYPSEREMRQCLREAIPSFLAKEDLEQALVDLDAVEAAKAGDVTKDPELAAAVARIGAVGAIAVDYSDAYLELAIARQRYLGHKFILYACYGLVGWENIPARFERQHSRITEATMAAIPREHLWAIGGRVFALRHLAPDQRKN